MSQPNEQSPELLRDPNLYIIFGMTVMAIVGVFSIAPALPQIVKALQISSAEIGLLISVVGIIKK